MNTARLKLVIAKFTATCIIIATVTLIAPTAMAFSDIEENNPNKGAIEWLLQQGIITETSNKFSPKKPITQGELLQWSWRAAGFRPNNGDKQTPYIRKARNTLVIPKGAFNAHKKVSKGEALDLMYKILGIGVTRYFVKQDMPFKDITINSPWAPIAKTALELGTERTATAFNPNKRFTREDAAYYLHETMGALQQGATGIPITYLTITGNGDGSGISIGGTGDAITENAKYKIFKSAWDSIHQKFVYQDRVDDNKLIQGAIKGMVDQLGDKFSHFFAPEDATGFSQQLSGEFEGIGVSIEDVDGKVQVISPLKGSPAMAAGMKPKDIIIEVDSKKTAGLKIEDVVKMIKGPKGTIVKIKVQRGSEEVSFDIERKHIKLDAVTGEMKGAIAYIQITDFTQSSPTDFANVMNELLLEKPTSFIIDLRGNPGGYLDASLAILDHFLPKKTRLSSIVFAKQDVAQAYDISSGSNPDREALDPNKPEIIFYSMGPAELASYPIKVLVDSGSASASEIMAASLKDNGHATLIGEKTYGKGSVQELTDYNDASMLKLTIGKWMTPNEQNMTDNPITPDVVVKDDPKTPADEVLDYALAH